MSDMDKVFKAKKTGQSAMEASKSDKARPEGDVDIKRYRNYYDISDTITTAQATDPHDEDHANYNQEQIFVSLERNAEHITVSNDGSDTLFVIASHEGGQNFARERPIYPGENKTFFNIYELRLRSATAGLAYRVTEYPICCTAVQRSGALLQELRVTTSAAQSSLTPTTGKKIRICAAHVSMTVTSNLTATVRASLSFGTGGVTNTTKILWSHRVDIAGESQIFLSDINVIGTVNETVTLTNTTFSAGAVITRAVIYYKED